MPPAPHPELPTPVIYCYLWNDAYVINSLLLIGKIGNSGFLYPFIWVIFNYVSGPYKLIKICPVHC